MQKSPQSRQGGTKIKIRKKKILLIETNAVIDKIYRIIFSREKDLEFRAINDFKELEKIAAKFKPDLILLGVHFPNDRDLEFVRILKNHRELKKIPIIILGPGHDLVSEKYFRAGVEEMIDVSRLPLDAIVQKVKKTAL